MLDESVFRGRRLAIVGSVCRDVKVGPLCPGPYLLEDGETPAEFVVETIGGGAANSALAAAALAADVRLAGKLGDDPLGRQIEQSLAARGVTTLLRRDAQVPTGSTVVLSYQNGARHFVSCQPNNESLAWTDLDLAVLAGAEHLLRADVWFSTPMLADGNRQLLAAARARGLATSLDINWDPRWGSGDAAAIAQRKQAVRAILPLVDLVHGNVAELNRFADGGELQTTLQQITAWGAGAIVVHLGAEGAGYYDHGRWTVAPAAPVRQYRNTAGTGDLLSVCMMLLHRRNDIPIEARLRPANSIVAEYIEGRRGVIPALG